MLSWRIEYCVADIFRGGVIFAFFAVEWDPRKISPIPSCVPFYVHLQTFVSVKHVAAAVATLQRLRGSTLILSSACCCQSLETALAPLPLRELISQCRQRVRPASECFPPLAANECVLTELDKGLRCRHFWYKLAKLTSRFFTAKI